MITPIRTLWASAALAVAASVAMAGSAQAATFSSAGPTINLIAKSETGSKKPRKNKAGKKSKRGNISFNDGSAESRSERDRRLSRECKGRSNSGVCEGYTR
jgi:uncharacterized membrane protein YhiD involved in acid resistance